jgi:UTP--glucose-1-phosphate uridylyltransferase
LIKKVIISLAGLGTRILPVNKAIPKELLLILDKSLTQIAVEEVIEAGITTLVFLTGSVKLGIEDHFGANLKLKVSLVKAGKDQMLLMGGEIQTG